MIYLVRGNDTPLIVALGLKDDNSTIPYDLTDVDRLRLSLVGHGMHVFAKDVAVRPSANTVQGIIPGRALLNGDYGLEVAFVKDGKDKRFFVETDGEGNPLFVVVNRIESDADDEAEGEGGGVEVTITIQPEVIDFAGETGTAAGFGTVTATVDSSVGTPSVTVTTSGPNTAKNFTFAFHNLKGANGSDASVTYANVVAALGYTPVTPEQLAAESDNFIALYNVTTWDEIDEAVDAGKVVFAVSGTTYYRLVDSDNSNTWIFVALSDEGLLQSLTCDTEDAWESDSFLLAKDSDLATKQDTLTFDNSPVQNSSNPVKSGGIYTALAGKQATISDLSAIRSGASAGATAYQKPNGGIPSSDMASAVRATLDKADTAYQKPGSGIPQTDLASGVQASLGKADTAYQKPGSGIPSTDMTSAVQTSLGKADSAYQKPGTGIPSTDLASAVTTSLGLADTAYQKPSGGIPSTDLASAVTASLGLANSAYQKPSGGIPSTDLASGVQTSLGKADTAYQKPSGGVPSTDMTTAVQTSLGKADTAYQKPSGGIPSTDMTTAVQTSLGKADTAVQDVSGKEDKSNKVTSISGSSTDTQYPSAKLVYDQLATKQATISTVNVTVDNNTGTPSGAASVSGSTLSLSFTNLKGAKGDTGATGATGPQGPKGDQGNTGSSVDYSYELVNNLTTNDATKGLSAAQGVVLEGEISQLGLKVGQLDINVTYQYGGVLPYKFKAGVTYIVYSFQSVAVNLTTRTTPSGSTVDGPFQVPGNGSVDLVITTDAEYLRISQPFEGVLFVKGSIAHKEYLLEKEVDGQASQLESLQEDVTQLQADFSELEGSQIEAKPGKNLFDKNSTLLRDNSVFNQAGVAYSDQYTIYWLISNPIDVSGHQGEKIICNKSADAPNRYCCFEDAQGNKTTAAATVAAYTIPANAVKAYILVYKSGGSVNLNEVQIEFGNASSEYEPYNPIGGYFVDEVSSDTVFPPSPQKDMHETYANINTAYIYNIFDSWVAKFPLYVTNTNLGKDASNQYDVNGYRIAFSTNPLFKILFICNQHGGSANGDPVMGAYIATQFISDICGSGHRHNERLQWIRDNAEIYIIPAANPWGIDNKRRVNYNGVNLNRNWPTSGWASEPSGQGTDDYKGAAAGDQPELQHYLQFISDTDPDIIIDNHTLGGTEGVVDANSGVMYVGFNKDATQNGTMYSSWLTSLQYLMRREYGVSPHAYGHTSDATPDCRTWCSENGVWGGLIEMQWRDPLDSDAGFTPNIIEASYMLCLSIYQYYAPQF